MSDYKPDVMIYHSNCLDGYGAAWAAWKRWGDDVRYLPCSYQNPPPDVSGKHVLIGDFSFKRDVMREMGEQAQSIIVLDHHETAQAELADWLVYNDAGEFWAGDNPFTAVFNNNEYVGQPIAALFDMTKSGAVLTWEFCHNAPLPLLLRLIQDRDLWQFSMPETKAFNHWLRCEPMDFGHWDEIDKSLNYAGFDRIMAEAEAMLRFFDQKVLDIAKYAFMGEIDGHTVPICNCPPSFASEVGHHLLTLYPDAPFSACYSDQGTTRNYSLRSADNRVNVAELAAKFGGGGHRNAAGYRLTVQ